MYRRSYILSTIRSVYESCGFQPLETPAMENLSVLTGKYGDEGDQLLYKVLNSGDYLSKVPDADKGLSSNEFTSRIAEKGLRYDLTVPFARHIVMNHGNTPLPFKRYQIQPVWRADRPQKGRYREFHQCDADVVGTTSLLCEAEIIYMIDRVFSQLGITDYDIRINHRALLSSIAEEIQAPDERAFLVTLDKLDKIGKDKFFEELSGSGISQTGIDLLDKIISLNGNPTEVLHELKNLLPGNDGLSDLTNVIELSGALGDDFRVALDPSLARGLSYYTGTIFEVRVNNVQIGSVSGGGRYDDLTGVFGLEGVSGVGISFGVDRIYDVLTELDLFPDNIDQSSDILITHFDQDAYNFGLKLLTTLRSQGVSVELFPDLAKMKKQMNYANRKSIPFVIVIGSNEIETGMVSLKNMKTGSQQSVAIADIAGIVQNP
jgi:histidyl-tRNA synthetase